MSDESIEQATSTELGGGTGFTYEDTVVAYYLTALLREERAAPDDGIVQSVAVQQGGHGYPMDDVIVMREEDGALSTLSLQVKRRVVISVADKDFTDILGRAVATRAAASFDAAHDYYGFAVENVARGRLRTLNRLIDWAKASPTGDHFAARFTPGGSAAAAERKMRQELLPALKVTSPEEERQFYARFVALELSGLTPGALLRTEVVNRLQELVAINEDGQDLLLFDRLCRIAREGAGTAKKWTRGSLLAQLKGAVRLKVAPTYQHDINLLAEFSRACMAEISEEIIGVRVERPDLEKEVRERLQQSRLVNLTGLPGCGKSAMLKRIASQDASKGPILFLKADRLEASSWLAFASVLRLRTLAIGDLLAEIGATGTPVLFIDGLDRVRPDNRGVINDILRSIETDARLTSWRVLATSRDQGLEPYRTWFPASFYRGTGIGDVAIGPFTDAEAEALADQMPSLRQLLFGAAGVQEITRRPFFAAVLARGFSSGAAISPQTEVDLIREWWDRAGHDASQDQVTLRQRALLDIAECGVRNLGKNVPARQLKDSTFGQVPGLKRDLVIRDHDGGASYSFTHDIFFEWAFFRHLIELGDAWTDALLAAGEPPLLGRVVGLLAQSTLSTPGRWSKHYRELEKGRLRPQWRREWLTAPPFTPAFSQDQTEFQALLFEDEFALLEKLLVWFQAQHSIPSPVILQNPAAIEGVDHLSIADLLSWPSDSQGWGRFLDWLLPLAPNIPPRLIPHVLEVFDVWQNLLADFRNERSARVIEVANGWLEAVEAIKYGERPLLDPNPWDELSSEAKSGLAKSLRMAIMRAARAYPNPAIALFERAARDKRMRQSAYADLMAFTPTMVDVSAEAIVAVVKAEIFEELPQEWLDREEREYRERIERIKRVRAIPESERTKHQRQAIAPHFVGRRDRPDFDNYGIDRFHSYYYPQSALREPFATLLAKKPAAGLVLIRDIANRATKAWRQLQVMDRRRLGTPIPVTVKFPWGTQEFWGSWDVYQWFMGRISPQPLECAFLALNYWAFKQIEEGRPTGQVLQSVLEGSECYASLGLALVLALETFDISPATFPIVACQRLWQHDIARVVHEPMRDADLLGLGLKDLTKLTGQQEKAKAFLDSRMSRRREVRELAMRFATNSDQALRARFKSALASFPDELPYEIEEDRSKAEITAALKEQAELWMGLGDIDNYREYAAGEDGYVVTYNPPRAPTPSQKERLENANTYLEEQSVIAWATRSLNSRKLGGNFSLDAAVAMARLRDTPHVLDERADVGSYTPQTMVSAVASVVICFGPGATPDYHWAWDVMERVAHMREPANRSFGSRIPWHPANHLIHALAHDRRASAPRHKSAPHLFRLTAHQVEDVGLLAFGALLADPDEHVRWVACRLAVETSIYYRPKNRPTGEGDYSVQLQAQQASLSGALERLTLPSDAAVPEIPPAWVQVEPVDRDLELTEDDAWTSPDPSFDGHRASRLLPLFPIEAWCGSDTYRPMFATMLKQLCTWSADRLMPPWSPKRRYGSDRLGPRLTEWNSALGDAVARAAPYFVVQEVQQDFLGRFLINNDEALEVLEPFASMTVIRHVIDAKTIPKNTFELLECVVDRVVADAAFRPGGHRGGEVSGWHMPRLLRALLFVNFAETALGSARFANGNWSEVARVMPIVTRLVDSIGWSTFVMENFMTLCERAGVLYPLDDFAKQTRAALDAIGNAKGSWRGTLLPARIAGTVQRLADANYPLRLDQAQSLLRLLDALIDLGDRRSAAIEQTEAFKGIRV